LPRFRLTPADDLRLAHQALDAVSPDADVLA
jgi:hypothetical protein